jgi:hypothetical protein
MLPIIPIAFLILLLIGEASSGRLALERSTVSTKAAATRKRLASA